MQQGLARDTSRYRNDGARDAQGDRSVTALYGISKDKASQVFRSFDPSQFMVYFIDEGDPENRSIEELNELAAKTREVFNDTRRIVGVVKGSPAFCRTVRDGVEDFFEALVFVGNERMLQNLGADVLDDAWKQGDEALSMDEVLGVTASLRSGDEVLTIHNGTRGIVIRRQGKFAHVELDGVDRALLVPLWAVRRVEEA